MFTCVAIEMTDAAVLASILKKIHKRSKGGKLSCLQEKIQSRKEMFLLVHSTKYSFQ